MLTSNVFLDCVILFIVKAGGQINIRDSLICVEPQRAGYAQKCPICYREMWNHDYRQRDGKSHSHCVLQRPRLLLHTDVGDAIFLLADLQRRGFHDQGY